MALPHFDMVLTIVMAKSGSCILIYVESVTDQVLLPWPKKMIVLMSKVSTSVCWIFLRYPVAWWARIAQSV
jgi:hypothetical protein